MRPMRKQEPFDTLNEYKSFAQRLFEPRGLIHLIMYIASTKKRRELKKRDIINKAYSRLEKLSY
jgi:hypothetical protein